MDIGIEVRRAISEYEGMCNGIVNKYFNKGLNGEFIKNEIENVILSKTCKLNNNYKIYNKNHLYLFTGTSLVKDYDLKDKLKDIKEATLSYKINFDLLFINCLDKIFVVDMASKNITEILIDKEMLIKIKAEAANK